MPGVSVYLADDVYQLCLKLDRGERSSIFANALRDYFSVPETLEDIKKKLDSLKEEENNVGYKIKILQKRKKDLEEKRKKEEQAKEDLIKGKDEYEDLHNFWSNITPEVIEEYKKGIKEGRWETSIKFYRIKTGKIEQKEEISQ